MKRVLMVLGIIVYAEAAFYDLSFSTEKEARDFIGLRNS